MPFDYWLAFIAASAFILAIPGPTIILVISQAAANGKKSVIPLALGVVLGDLTALTCSLLGLGAVIAASATLFTFFKWIGAGYLIYLGIKTWLPANQPKKFHQKQRQAASPNLFKKSFLVTAFNPKSIAFFIAFLPQFIAPDKSANVQMLILASSFLFMAALNALLYGLFATHLAEFIFKGKKGKWLDRVGGTTLIGAGLATAAMEQ